MKNKISLKGVLIFIISLALLVFILFGHNNLFNFYQKTSNLISSIFDRSFDYKRFSEIRAENQRLKFQIEKLSENLPLKNDFKSRKALVYSRYPFSNRGIIIINLGESDGIQKDMPVLKNDFLLGKIINVSNHQSEVQTIFDSNWKSSVGVGDYSKKAVLEGGSNPKATLIPKEADVEVGDQVFSLSPEYPIYQPLGTLSDLKNKSGEIWRSGNVNIPYDMDDIKTVRVLISFP